MNIKKDWGVKLAVLVTGLFCAAFMVSSAFHDGSKRASGNVRGEWTTERVADLSMKVRTNYELPQVKADCIAASTAGAIAWRTWKGLATVDQDTAIIHAGFYC